MCIFNGNWKGLLLIYLRTLSLSSSSSTKVDFLHDIDSTFYLFVVSLMLRGVCERGWRLVARNVIDKRYDSTCIPFQVRFVSNQSSWVNFWFVTKFNTSQIQSKTIGNNPFFVLKRHTIFFCVLKAFYE